MLCDCGIWNFDLVLTPLSVCMTLVVKHKNLVAVKGTLIQSSSDYSPAGIKRPDGQNYDCTFHNYNEVILNDYPHFNHCVFISWLIQFNHVVNTPLEIASRCEKEMHNSRHVWGERLDMHGSRPSTDPERTWTLLSITAASWGPQCLILTQVWYDMMSQVWNSLSRLTSSHCLFLIIRGSYQGSSQ